jgi:hypothetical protein
MLQTGQYEKGRGLAAEALRLKYDKQVLNDISDAVADIRRKHPWESTTVNFLLAAKESTIKGQYTQAAQLVYEVALKATGWDASSPEEWRARDNRFVQLAMGIMASGQRTTGGAYTPNHALMTQEARRRYYW